MKIAGIDVHKKVLMVVVLDSSAPEEKPARRRFVTLPSELQRFRMWLQEQGVEEAVINLLGASGLRILHALAEGETDAKKLAELGGERLHCTEKQVVDALTGRVQPMHRGISGKTLRT